MVVAWTLVDVDVDVDVEKEKEKEKDINRHDMKVIQTE